jgi:hypothetical protein
LNPSPPNRNRRSSWNWNWNQSPTQIPVPQEHPATTSSQLRLRLAAHWSWVLKARGPPSTRHDQPLQPHAAGMGRIWNRSRPKNQPPRWNRSAVQPSNRRVRPVRVSREARSAARFRHRDRPGDLVLTACRFPPWRPRRRPTTEPKRDTETRPAWPGRRIPPPSTVSVTPRGSEVVSLAAISFPG